MEDTDPKLTGVPFNDAYRYMDWLLTVPLLLIEILLVERYENDGVIPMGRPMPKIGKVKEACKTALEEAGVLEQSEEDGTFQALTGSLINICFGCYGEKYHKDRNYFCSTNQKGQMQLNSAGRNLRRKKSDKMPSEKDLEQEEVWMNHWLDKTMPLIEDEDLKESLEKTVEAIMAEPKRDDGILQLLKAAKLRSAPP